jgi:hypothetical protein
MKEFRFHPMAPHIGDGDPSRDHKAKIGKIFQKGDFRFKKCFLFSSFMFIRAFKKSNSCGGYNDKNK